MKKVLVFMTGGVLLLGGLFFWLWPEKGAAAPDALLTAYTTALETKDRPAVEKIVLDTVTEQQIQERLEKFGGTPAQQMQVSAEGNSVSSAFVQVHMQVQGEGAAIVDEFYLKNVDQRWYISFPH